MVPLGEPGPRFRPDHDYFSVQLVAVHLPGRFMNLSRFAPVVWSTLRYFSLEGERTLVGMFPRADEGAPDFARKDRVDVLNLQLTPRLVASEEITVGFTLGAIKEKDYLAGVINAATELAATPAAAYLSQITPAVGALRSVAQTAEKVVQAIDKLLDQNRLQMLGAFNSTLRSPVNSGLAVFIDERNGGKDLRFDPARNLLMDGANPVRSPYAVLRLVCDPTRPDWMLLPDLNQAWLRIREAALSGGDILAAIEYFRVTALTSPDLTRADAERLAEAAQSKFAPVISGEESAFIGDPGDMAESLTFFIGGGYDEAESLTIGAGAARSAAALATPAQFNRSLEIVLEHEGGYVDHPNDPGGATNRGVTQRTYDDYRKHKGQPKRSVRELEPDECREIYFHGFWRPAMCHDMPNEATALLTFDAAVNHGPRQAIKLLQQASGMPDSACDGIWGPATRARVIAAAANAQGFAEAILMRRERFYRRIVELNPRLGAFLRGWMNRLVLLRGKVQPMLAGAPQAGEGESGLYSMDGACEPLVAADADFSAWIVEADGAVARAAQ